MRSSFQARLIRAMLVSGIAAAFFATPAFACPGDGGGAPQSIKDHFCGAWNAAAGRGINLGVPLNDAHRWGNGWTRDFDRGQFGRGAILEGDGVGFAFVMGQPWWNTYVAVGGAPGDLGYPTGRHEFGGHINNGARENKYMTLRGGVMNSWSAGTFATWGAIRAKWDSLGHVSGPVGRPLSNELATARVRGRYSVFEGGNIIYNPRINVASHVYGGILNKYRQLGYSNHPLGLPTSDRQRNPARGNEYQVFDGGVINQYGGNAYETHGAILSRWQRGGGPNGSLGLPTSDEQEAHRSPQGTTGRYSRFQNGLINSSRRGAFVLFGAIGAKYASLGYSRSYLGFPVSEEYSYNGGKSQNFEGGSIFWRAGHQAITNREDGSEAFRKKPDEGRDGPGANGCGPQGGLTNRVLAEVIPDGSPVFNFRRACNRHDRCYARRGANRRDCDQRFLANMRVSCNRYRIRRKSCRFWARFYYKAVRKRGAGPFANAQRNAR